MYVMRQILHISNSQSQKENASYFVVLNLRNIFSTKKRKKKEKEKRKYFSLFKTCSSRTYIWHKSKIDNQLCELVWLCI